VGRNWGYTRAGWEHEAPFGVDDGIERSYRRTGLSQSEAARLLGVTQPRISDLMRGKIELFGLDTLVNMIGAAGLRVEMDV
jgi:predicted XRE-type DNA-binding protein